MRKHINETITNIGFIGDIHGDFKSLLRKIKDYENTCFIICGDIGIGFSDQPLKKLKGMINTTIYPFLKKRNNIIICLRGNHDDPSYFNDDIIDNDRFYLASDYSVINFKTKNILLIGGGLSIDRQRRVIGKSYWSDELPKFDKDKLDSILNQYHIDVIASHTTVSFADPTDKGEIVIYFSLFDEKLLEDQIKERSIMDDIYNYIISKQGIFEKWFYGHFHKSYNTTHNSINFIGLDIEEIKEYYIDD